MKQYKTPEECLKENGEHAWYKLPKSNIGCLVYHLDGYCSWDDPVYKCYHCPAKKTWTRKSPPIYGWVDENGKDIEVLGENPDGTITIGDSFTSITSNISNELPQN